MAKEMMKKFKEVIVKNAKAKVITQFKMVPSESKKFVIFAKVKEK